MFKNGHDKTLLFLLLAALVTLGAVLAGQGRSSGVQPPSGVDKAVERELAYQARAALLQKIYAPADELIRAGELQRALLKLDELALKYPSEAHGHILKGEILGKMGALDQALHSYVAGVRLNGDYLDPKNPLSRRAQIKEAVEEGAKTIPARVRANPGNATLAASLKDVNYLVSRLAGGCE
ncbi:hypothetical protein [Geomonas sp.]|uniref:hypothetical protein n=1 Tax=Geomonas sp. TaxID=2651584 RepID=UPI002B4792B2|nr:hypothetical protein [Geomonas sp.]HJV33448.1 hypothetical protein [Geomonas sp.]